VRRIRLVVFVGVVMAAILALSAGPAMADDFDDDVFFLNADFDDEFDDDVFDDDGFDDVLLLDEGSATFDELCSPGLPDGIFIPGCIFSDVEEDDDDFIDDDDIFDDGDVVFLVEADDVFDDDDFFDDNDDGDRDHNRRHRG
jgi:hypothetical protein